MPASTAARSVCRLEEFLYSACLLEATARKPGNVHPEASFVDLTHRDFVSAARVSAPILAQSARTGVGPAIRSAVAATRSVAPSNVNLGIVLLLAPLAAVPEGASLVDAIPGILRQLSIDDARQVYRAIRLARPGGLGSAPRQDIAEEPTGTLRDVMALAADRDRIAWQYAHDFADVLEWGVAWLARQIDFENHWEQAIVGLQLELLARVPDSLIARKCGMETAAEASDRARNVLASGWPHASNSARDLDGFDRWLRADGNRRNPGTTADLIAACLFAAMREGAIRPPDWATRPDLPEGATRA